MADPVSRDTFSASKAWLRALEMTARIEREPQRTLPIVIDELAIQFGETPALLSDRGALSFAALAARMNTVARWALAQNLSGKIVGLLMPNEPDYLAIWLGITRVGGSVALLNTNLRGTALAHCITVAEFAAYHRCRLAARRPRRRTCRGEDRSASLDP